LEDLVENIRFKKYNESILKTYSKKVQDLVCAMLQKQKEERITITDILKAEFIYVKIKKKIIFYILFLRKGLKKLWKESRKMK